MNFVVLYQQSINALPLSYHQRIPPNVTKALNDYLIAPVSSVFSDLTYCGPMWRRSMCGVYRWYLALEINKHMAVYMHTFVSAGKNRCLSHILAIMAVSEQRDCLASSLPLVWFGERWCDSLQCKHSDYCFDQLMMWTIWGDLNATSVHLVTNWLHVFVPSETTEGCLVNKLVKL